MIILEYFLKPGEVSISWSPWLIHIYLSQLVTLYIFSESSFSVFASLPVHFMLYGVVLIFPSERFSCVTILVEHLRNTTLDLPISHFITDLPPGNTSLIYLRSPVFWSSLFQRLIIMSALFEGSLFLCVEII